MGEGVDPTSMCQRLLDKIAQSKQLVAIADPELLLLFEDWLEELEDEVRSLATRDTQLNPTTIAGKLGLSERGAIFLLSKLKREGKL